MPRTLSASTSTLPGSSASRLDDARWAAVIARDAAFDGRFVTAVETTGIY
ncbi:MAG: Ada metal-binding domain-containing protein, partial [Methyloceanibacter sp.]